mmetsp:Transcript_32952/g.40761  ORF Transcript_32952/g.40761 Transcript_32952/m.40761 type:complete len:102 (+) Transcript_32952:1028-1333(+)
MCDGNIVYQGDARASASYFNQIGKPVPRFANPADYFMKLLSINYPKGPADEEKIGELRRNYHAMLEKAITAENRMVRLDAPNDFGSQGVINHKADTTVQLQ